MFGLCSVASWKLLQFSLNCVFVCVTINMYRVMIWDLSVLCWGEPYSTSTNWTLIQLKKKKKTIKRKIQFKILIIVTNCGRNSGTNLTKWSQWDSNTIETEASDEKNTFVISKSDQTKSNLLVELKLPLHKMLFHFPIFLSFCLYVISHRQPKTLIVNVSVWFY